MGLFYSSGRQLLIDTLRPKQITFQSYTTANRPTPASTERVMIYNSTANALQYWNGTAWGAVGTAGSVSALDDLTDVVITAAASGEALVYNGTNWVDTAISGDVALTGAGVATVTDLTISGEAQGNIIYFNGTNWVRLAVGTSGQFLQTQGASANPQWATVTATTANGLGSPFTIEGGTYDPSTTVTAQTSSAAALTIPDLAGVAQQWVFTDVAQTLVAKTLTAPKIANGGFLADANGNEQIKFTTTASAVNELTVINAATGSGVEIGTSGGDADIDLLLTAKGTGVVKADGVAVVTLTGTQTLTNKTLTAPVISTISNTGTVTLFTATDTVVGRATTDTLTNKTLNADGTGNVLTNINGDELDPIAATNATYGIPITLVAVNSGAATLNIFSSNAPYKFRVIDAHAINTKATNNGNWKLDDGTTDITTNVAYGASDKALTRCTSIDDATHAIAANGSLRLQNSDATDTAIVYVTIMRVD